MPHMIANLAPNPISVPRDYAAPILPPRQTGRSINAQQPRSWKSWPMLVIVLASIAIVVAVVMMVWPPAQADAGRHVTQPPAPERMETNPLPPPGAGNSNGADPWGGHSQADPAPATPRVTPDPLPPSAPPQNHAAPQDPFADPFGGIGSLGLNASPDIMMTAMAHACTKLKSCPNADDVMTQICETVAMFPQTAPPTCDAGKRCLESIDKLDCNATFDNTSPLALANQFQDCVKAATSC